MSSRVLTAFLLALGILLIALLLSPFGSTLRYFIHPTPQPSSVSPSSKNPPPTTLPPSKIPRTVPPTVAETKELLETTILSEVVFSGLSFTECIDALNELIQEQGIAQQDLHIIYEGSPPRLVPSSWSTIWKDLELRNASVASVLRHLIIQSRLGYQIGEGVVEIVSTSSPSFIQNKLNEVIIPKIDFENITIEEAFDFLRQHSQEIAFPNNPRDKGISFSYPTSRFKEDNAHIHRNSDARTNLMNEALTITWRAENVSLRNALNEITSRTGLLWGTNDHGVFIFPKSLLEE